MNRPVVLLWVSVDIRSEKNIRFKFPLFLPSLLMTADILEDMANFGKLFIRGKTFGKDNISFEDLAGYTLIFKKLMLSFLFETGPLDLVDVDVKNKDDWVRVACRLR